MNQIEEGNAMANEAIAKAGAAADPAWKAAALEAVHTVCQTHRVFNSDDVFELLDATGESTHENRAFGMIMRQAFQAGWCKKVEAYPEFTKSRRAHLHRTPLQNWESLLQRGVEGHTET